MAFFKDIFGGLFGAVDDFQGGAVDLVKRPGESDQERRRAQRQTASRLRRQRGRATAGRRASLASLGEGDAPVERPSLLGGTV